LGSLSITSSRRPKPVEKPLVQFLPNGECRIAADHDRVGLVPMLTALRLSFPEVGYQKVRWFMARVF